MKLPNLAARRRGRGSDVLGALLASMCVLTLANAAAIEARADMKWMIVGDSITHGHEGDYTWRYRMWQWARDNGLSVDFVGPYSGTMPPNEPGPPEAPRFDGEPEPEEADPSRKYSGLYASSVDSGFDSDHYATWGRQAAQNVDTIGGQVSTYSPDYILMALGFNDLGWFVSGPEGLLSNMKKLVDNSRSQKSDIKFAIANVPFRTFIGGRQDLVDNTERYNDMLADAISEWSTRESPIHLVKFREHYSCELDGCPGGHDGLHPNALGEFEIAQAFSRVLHDEFGLGNGAISIPANIPVRPCPVPQNIQAFGEPSGLVVKWDAVFGAFGYHTRSRLAGQSEWQVDTYTTSANAVYRAWVGDDQEWEYSVASECGDNIPQSAWTGTASVVVHPQTAPGPSNIRTSSNSEGVLSVSWDPPEGSWNIDRYGLITWDKDTEGSFINTRGVAGTSYTVDGLKWGHHYQVAVVTYTDVGGGLPAGGPSVTIGGGTPSTPGNVKVDTRDPTTVRLTWEGSNAAAGYYVYYRNINEEGSELAKDGTGSYHPAAGAECWGVAFLFPGTWNFEFCLTAYNGDLESDMSNCVIPSKEETANMPECPEAVSSPIPGGDDGNNGGGGDGGGGNGGGDGGGDDDGGDPVEGDPQPYDPDSGEDDEEPICDAEYGSIDEIADDADNISLWCGPYYVLKVAQKMLKKSTERYQEILDDGYDSYFGT